MKKRLGHDELVDLDEFSGKIPKAQDLQRRKKKKKAIDHGDPVY